MYCNLDGIFFEIRGGSLLLCRPDSARDGVGSILQQLSLRYIGNLLTPNRYITQSLIKRLLFEY